jgi:flagellar basal-body rod protein FlgG
MYKGMYVAATGMNLKLMELDTTANNLANINTAGFKKSNFAARLYPLLEGITDTRPPADYPNARSMAHLGSYTVDQSQGSFQTTGSQFDVSIEGEGYFQVEKDGQKFFTRNGSFHMDREGTLVTSNGYKVLDPDGSPITLDTSVTRPPSIGIDGIIFQESIQAGGAGSEAGTIGIFKVKDIKPVSEALLAGTSEGVSTGLVRQGVIERSNINPVRELVGMVTASREFGMLQQMIRSFDELSQRAVSEIAKV